MLIAEGLARIFAADDAADFLFNALAGDIFPVSASQAALEKKLKLEQSLGGVNVFIGRRPADGRFVHMNIFGDVTQHHRPQLANAMVEKIQLEFKNTLSHAVKRLLALLNAFDQPSGGAHLFLEILPCLLFRHPLLPDHAAVKRAYAQPRNSIIIQVDDILASDLLNKNIG